MWRLYFSKHTLCFTIVDSLKYYNFVQDWFSTILIQFQKEK